MAGVLKYYGRSSLFCMIAIDQTPFTAGLIRQRVEFYGYEKRK